MGRHKLVGWGLIELVAFGWAISCDQTEEGGRSQPGADDSAGGGRFELMVGSGGMNGIPESTGGALAELCVGLETPAGNAAADIRVGGGCTLGGQSSVRSFSYPLDGVEIPTAQLQLLLLPEEGLSSLGGHGGQPWALLPLPLEVTIDPPYAAVLDENRTTFTVTDSVAKLSSAVTFGPEGEEFLKYLELYGGEQERDQCFVARVALGDETSILSERRVIFEPRYFCIVK